VLLQKSMVAQAGRKEKSKNLKKLENSGHAF
jgi:hypothetical protein